MKRKMGILAALGMLFAVACEPAAPAVTADDLLGFWERENEFGERDYIRFDPDGTFAATRSIEWFEIEDLIEQEGTFVVEEDRLTFFTNAESQLCGGNTGVYEMQFTEEGWLEFTRVEEECGFREMLWDVLPWRPVSP